MSKFFIIYFSIWISTSLFAQETKTTVNPNNLDEELIRVILMGYPSRYNTAIVVDEKKSNGIRTEAIPPTQGSIEDLIKRGANPNYTQRDGTSVLMLALQYGNFQAAKTLLESGAKTNVRDSRGMTPLHMASCIPTIPIDLIDTLLKHNADIHAMDTEIGLTPLMNAVMVNNRVLAQFLIEQGADPNTQTKDGINAITLARQDGSKEMITLLESSISKQTSSPPTSTSNTTHSSYFTLPPDTAISLKIIPLNLAKEIVAKVGEGGVTREEFEEAKKMLASNLGYERAPEGGYSKIEVKLTPQEEANAFWSAIDDELLFQGAIDDSIVNSKHIQNRIRDEFQEMISALPEIKREKENPYRFKSMREPYLPEFTENQIKNYYDQHPQYFQAPVKVRVKHIAWPANADEEGGMTTRHLNEARNNPEATNEWEGDEWVTEGYDPQSVRDGSLDNDLPKLFQTPKGSVSPILKGTVYKYVFWVVDRQESSGLRPLEEVRDLVLYRMAMNRSAAYNKIRQEDPERFYRMALHKGIHRKLKGEICSRFLTKFYNPPPGRKREEVIAEMKTKYPVEILLKDPIFAKDQRKEYWEKKEKEELNKFVKPRSIAINPFSSKPEKTGDPEIDQILIQQADLKDRVSYSILIAAGAILIVWLIRWLRA